MTKIIKVDCDKWNDRLVKFGIGLLIIGWSALTFGLAYAEYYFITWSLPLIKTASDWGFCIFVILLLGVFNVVNLYFASRVIYQKQNLFKFKCVSGEEPKTSNGATNSQYVSNKEYFEEKEKQDSK